MRYALLGDIHGNLEALETVLADVAKEKPDRYVCLGDMVGYGADPVPCLERIKGLDCPIVAGNHDFAAAGIFDPDFFSPQARQAIHWTTEQLSPDDLEFLRQLKLIARVDQFTISHSSFYLPEMFEYIQTNYDLYMGFSHLKTPLGFIGHSHVPIGFVLSNGVFTLVEPQKGGLEIKVDLERQTIVNIGSVGQPRDNNPQAAYALYDTDKKVIKIKRVDYDIEQAAQKIIQAKLPAYLAERLKHGN